MEHERRSCNARKLAGVRVAVPPLPLIDSKCLSVGACPLPVHATAEEVDNIDLLHRHARLLAHVWVRCVGVQQCPVWRAVLDELSEADSTLRSRLNRVP
eukprot:CAMPEP_0181216026 /NCGR_PEP_ID=MMETSP1096-20121128/26349_1 /TAXON_ID=156174 ORGANISM="Chrysochromulina ericina, Strain CCMP281" /NCGR_SAMPLE_ID=MMETSP1096 /ASSEMBLY_ACC=CAM_ASM_000453 /LENGTH=98 /DNA_ID=CAMNT_0023307965 /DNA_START=354 /DNA_END=650 /DNA_ORIENTATION=-